MKRGAPLRRTGFKRRTYDPVKPPPATRSERAGTYGGTTTGVAIEKEAPVVCEAYRRLVRQLPCARCGIVGFTQFCHADLGKGMGLKTDDRRGWPGCGPHGDDPGCHHYVGRVMSREERRQFEEEAGAATRQAIDEAGLWPANLPRWPS